MTRTTAPQWLPVEYRAEFERLAREMLGRAPEAEAAELLAVTSVLMTRWREVAAPLAKEPRNRRRIVAADTLLQTAKQVAASALLVARDSRH